MLKKLSIAFGLLMAFSAFAAVEIQNAGPLVTVISGEEKIVINTVSGGTIVEYNYRSQAIPCGLHGGEQLCRVRLSKPDSAEFAGKWDAPPIEKKGGRTIISMSCEGPFASRVTKEFIFEEGKPGFILRLLLQRESEGVGSANYTMWLQNKVSLSSGKYALAISGREKPLILTGQLPRETYSYAPAENYSGIVNLENGTGLFMLASPKSLDAFYVWASSKGDISDEICFRNIEIKATETFETEVRFLPVIMNQEDLKSLMAGKLKPSGAAATAGISKAGKTNEPGVIESEAKEPSLNGKKIFVADYNKSLDGQNAAGCVSATFDQRNAAIAADGRFGSCAKISGGGGILYPVKGNINPNKGSIEMWISPDFSPDDKEWRYLFRMDGKAVKKDVNANCIHLVRSAHNQLRASIFDKSGLMRRAYRGELDFQPGKWYHVKMVWDFERPVYKTQYIELYINGSNRGNEYGLADKKIEFELESPTFSIGANYKGRIDAVSIASEPEQEAAKPERQIDLDAVKPMLKWLKPYIKGQTKVLFITDYNCAEDISALAGMMDLNVKAVKFVYPYPFDSIFLFYDNQSIISNGDAAVRMRQALTEKYDVIVLGPASFKQHIPADIQSSIVEQVSKGTGLIAVTPHDFAGQPLSKLLPVEVSGNKICDGRMMIKSGSASAPVPMSALPPVFFQSLSVLPGAESVAVSGGSPVIVKGTSGNGKIYVFGWLGIGENMIGKVENNNATTALTPRLSRKGENKYWLAPLKRYHRLLLAEALLDVAGKKSGYSITAIGNESGLPVLEINASEGVKAELDCLVSAADGLWQRRFTQPVTLAQGVNRIKPEIESGVPGGDVQLDVVVRINGKAAAAGGFAVNVKNNESISSIVSTDIWHQGRTEDVTVNFTSKAAGDKLKWTVADKNGRIGAEAEQNVSGGSVKFTVDTSRLLPPFARLTAELYGADGRIKALAGLDRILLPAKRTDFNHFIHYTWGRGEDCFPLEYGLIGQHWHKTGNIDLCNSGTLPIPYFWKFGSKIGYEDSNIKDKVVDGKHIRGGSLSDPQFLAKTEQDLTARTITWKKYEPAVYILNDETRHSPSAHVYWEGDYNPAALEKFREWLKVRYSSLDKLNMEWDTVFTSWNAVQPMTLDEVKKRGTKNYAPWADFRDFNDDAFANYVKFCADTIKKTDPGVRTGMSGTESPYVSSGFDWWKMSGALGTVWSYDGIQVELLRSFAPYRDIVVNNYSIGYGWHGPELFYLMFRSMLNQNHGLASWKADLFFTPEGSLSLSGKDTKRITDLFRTGLWEYTRSFKREKNVAVLYSMSSLRAAFAEGKYERYRDSVQGWSNLLYDCCISWSFIAEEQLDKGILEQEKYQVVVLPLTMAVSDKEIAALKRFVSAGGAVIMDDSAGMFSANCKPRAKSLNQEIAGEKVKVINDNLIDYMVDSKFYKKASMSGWQQKFRSLFESLGVKPFAQISVNGSPFRGHSAAYSGDNGSRLLLALPAYQISASPQNIVEVKTDFSGNCWSPVTHTVYSDGIKDKVERGWPLAAVLSPEKGGTFEIMAVQNDGRVEYAVKAGASSFVPTYFSVQVIDPKGRPAPVYNNTLIVPKPGSYAGSFKLALNDPEGEWSLIFSDGLTGVKHVRTFKWR